MEPNYRVGQYMLEKPLGVGGITEVWLGRHVHWGTLAAVKCLNRAYAGVAGIEQRFLDEGLRQGSLDHPNIVKVYGYEFVENRNFLILQYVNGSSLADLLVSAGRLEPTEAVRLGISLCDALNYAHERGVVHRDLKPSNILLDANRTPYLGDFGIVLAPNESDMTRAGTIMGTVLYMSPEQIVTPNSVDHRSDLYSFGCVLFEMLAGEPPFNAASAGQDHTGLAIMRGHLYQTPHLRQNNPALPPWLDAVVMRCLAKIPAERYCTGREVRDALSAPLAHTVRARTIIEPGAGGEFTRMFNAPTAPPSAYPPPPPPPAAAFPGMFGGREPARPAPLPGAYASPPPPPHREDEASEFTRMFNSPQEPVPLKPVQGPPDPFGGRPNVPQPQQAPAGEFTQMFGRHDGPPPPPPAIATPTPRLPSASGATSVFETPRPQMSGGASYGQQYQGPPPSVGAGSFTSVMSRPPEGIVPQRSAETPSRKLTRMFRLTGRAFAAIRNLFRAVPSGTPGPSREFQIDNVHFTMTAPARLSVGQTAEIRLWAHLENQRRAVLERAKDILGGSRIKKMIAESEGPFSVPRGSHVEIRLKVEGIVIRNRSKWLVWAGEVGTTSFLADVPLSSAPGPHAGLASIRIGGAEVAKMEFVLFVAKTARPLKKIPIRLAKHKRAFASYASQDRDSVVARIQGMQKAAPGLDVFLDVVKLRSGQYWEEEVTKQIVASDVFYLFWSHHAMASQWVDKEWRCAYNTRGLDFIDPVPLEDPATAPPPRELAGKHFNDPLLQHMKTSGTS
jgi:serine/threonine protein kinase